MSELGQQRCETCSGDAPTVTEQEKSSLHKEVPGWEIIEVEGEDQLHRVFKLKNFAQALAFTNKVGDLAEAENHHPKVLLEYGKVTVSWWTHSIGGLHKNDFIMAARTDAAYQDWQ